MCRNLSKIFLSTVSVFSIGSMAVSTFAVEHNFNKIVNKENLNGAIIVKSEEELIKALKNESVKKIVIEGNVRISKDIDLSKSSRNIVLIVGSSNVKDSSLIVEGGVKINGGGRLSIIKNNSSSKSIMNFKVSRRGEALETIFENLNIIGEKNKETIINNASGKMVFRNITIENLTLFGKQKSTNQIFQKINFINSSINSEYVNESIINEKDIVKTSSSVTLKGKIDPKIPKEQFWAIGIDEDGDVINAYSVKVDDDGNVQADFNKLKQNTKYKFYFVTSYSGNSNGNLYFSKHVSVSTIDFKSSIESVTSSSAKIKVAKNSLESKYYPMKIILRYGNQILAISEVTDKAMSANLIYNFTGLKENLNYNYEILSYVNGENKPVVMDKGSFKTLKDSDGSNDNASNDVNLNYMIPQDDIKNFNIYDVGVKIPLNGKIKEIADKGKNFKTNINGVEVKYVNGNFLISKLVPNKDYSNLKVSFLNESGKMVNVSIPKFTTISETTNINKFVRDVYFNAFNRNPDEIGFWYWIEKLSIKEVSAKEFVKNLLNEKEFLEIRPTTRNKIDGLYKVIVNRSSDESGMNFWINIYDSLKGQGYSDEYALREIVDRMINENEFKDIINF